MLAEAADRILTNLLRCCTEIYGERLVSLGVFGSVGRGSMHHRSDIDILLVIDDPPGGRLARMDEFSSVEERLEADLDQARCGGWDTDLSPVIKSPDEVRQGSLLFLDMLDDLKLLHDREGFFEKYLAGFSKRLKELGARKIRRGSTWYWDLKPDFRPGEVIEL